MQGVFYSTLLRGIWAKLLGIKFGRCKHKKAYTLNFIDTIRTIQYILIVNLY
jgi:hypothetical protein